MAKKTIATLEARTLDENDGAAAAATSMTTTSHTHTSSSSKNQNKRSIHTVLAKLGFRQKQRGKHNNMKVATTNKSEATPLLESNKRNPLSVSFSKDEENQSQTVVVVSPASVSNGKKSWNKLKARVGQGDLLLPGVSQPLSTDNDDDVKGGEKNNNDRASMVQDAMGDIRSGMEIKVTTCLIAILIYLLAAIGGYHYVWQPEWTMIDACYFAVTTFTTVGYGDLVPTSTASMMFTCVYALTGVACLGIALGILGSNLIDAQETAINRAAEVSRYQVLSVFDVDVVSSDPQQQQQQQKQTAAQDLPSSQPTAAGTSSSSSSSSTTKIVSLLLHNAHNIPLVCIMLGLAFWIGKESKWDTPQTIYYLVMTASTIGYGDLTPPTQTGRWIAIFFIPMACAATGQWLGVVATWIIDGRQRQFWKSRMAETRELTQRDLDIMDDNGDGLVSRAEFLEFMLVAMNKIDQELVTDLRRHFDKLDTDGTGELSRDDMLEAAKRRLKSPLHKLKLAAYKHQLLETTSAGGDDVEGSTNGDGRGGGVWDWYRTMNGPK